MIASAPILPVRTALRIVLGLCGGLLTLLYVGYQARFLIIGPAITLAPAASARTNERVVTLTGSAANITRLWLNDRPIFTDRSGNFSEALVLENGYTIATLRAEDRYGRMTRVYREYVYIPATFIE